MAQETRGDDVHMDMHTTLIPSAPSTLPPSSGECAYDELLASIRVTAERTDLAFAVAVSLENLDPVCAAELAPRLYEVVKHG